MVRTFRFHAGLAAAAILIYAAAFRLRGPLLASIPLAAFLLAPTVASFLPKSPPRLAPGSVTLLSANLLVGSSSPAHLLKLIDERDPDVILLQEYSPKARDVLLPALSSRYPHVVEALRDDAFGQAVYSKLPPVGVTRLYPESVWGGGTTRHVWAQEPQIRIVVEVAGRHVVIQNVHTLPPINPDHLAEQQQALQWLAAYARHETRPLVLAGDFNCTRDAPDFARLLRDGALDAHALAGHARGATWCAKGRLRFAPGVRIDHVLLAHGLACDKLVLLDPIGSDHLPTFARIGFPAGQ